MASKNDETLEDEEKNAVIRLKRETPLEIEWSLGWKKEIGLIDISKSDRVVRAFFASEHVGVILEYDTTNKTKRMDVLTGHRNCISSFDADVDGGRLVTTERGHDKSMIIVWDSFQRIPVFQMLSSYKTGTALVKFSVDSQYLITVSNDNNSEQTVDVWNWKSSCAEKLFCSTKLDNSFGPIVHLACSYDHPDFYCFTTKERIFFMTLEEKAKKLTTIVPKQDPKQRKYNYTQSTYVTNFRQVVSASTGGFVTVWDDMIYNQLEIKNTPVTNNKLLLKTVKLDYHCITTILCKKHIITGNTNGEVCFYDKSLCFVYRLNWFIGDSITSIAMVNNSNISNEKPVPEATISVKVIKDEVEKSKNSKKIQHLSRSNNNNNNRKRIDVKTIKQEFECDPFFISTKNCKIFRVDIAKNSYIQMHEQVEEEFVTAMDVHPEKYCVLLGSSIGTLSLYDFQTKKLIANTIGDQKTENYSQVTCVKYSSTGSYLCYGCANGTFSFVDSHALTAMIEEPFRWNDEETSKIQNITFSESSNYVVYTDDSFGMYIYGIRPSKKFSVKYYGCSQVHRKAVLGVSMTEYTSNLMIYSVGADHRIAVLNFDKRNDEHPELVKVIKIPPEHEPRCMMKSSVVQKEGVVNLIISSNNSCITVWNDDRCIRTTPGVGLQTAISVMKESSADKSVMFFCNDTDIGFLRQPVDGNPYRNVAVHGSGTKLIDIGISQDGKCLFSISEKSNSVLIWSVNTSYLDELEKKGGDGLNPYSSLLKEDEINQLKQFFNLVQLRGSQHPEEVVFDQFIDVFEIRSIMSAMGHYLSETELFNMVYEMRTRDENKIGHLTMVMTFEEMVILYLSYKPKTHLKVGDIRRAFDRMVFEDQSRGEHGEKTKKGQLTKKSFVHMLKNMGEKMSDNELQVIFDTLWKPTNSGDGSSSSGHSESTVNYYDTLPDTFTFEDIMSKLFGFKDAE